LTFKEGDKIELSPKVTDPENAEVTVSYSGWMSSASYQTTYDDAGMYSVTIVASDGKKESSTKVKITVDNTNRAPKIEKMPKLSVTEGDLLTLTPVVSDADGDKVTVSFDTPFDSEGKWQTKEGDAGTYKAKVIASDGTDKTTIGVDVVIEPLNKAPTLADFADINVKEGETVVIVPDAKDPEGVQLTYTYSGWMTSERYTTSYTGAGTYSVKVTVSDGVYEVSKNVKVVVEDVNRAPQFSCIVDCE
jgi:lipocalin